MAIRKYVSFSNLKSFFNNLKTKFATKTEVEDKANKSHSHSIADVTNLQSTLDGKASASHNHSASNITSGTLSSDRLPTIPISKGGTGATTAASALTNLGITATASELNYVDGVTSNIQTQLNNKSASNHTHNYLALSGGTITGLLDADKVFRNGNTFYNVLEYASTTTVDEIVIKTKIPFVSGNSMPLVHLKGYAYGESATIEMTVAFYIYNDKFTNMGVVSFCPWKPNVYLSSYTENNTKYIAISFAGSIYYPRFIVDYTDIWSGSNNRDYSSGWTYANRISGETTSIIPTTDKVSVSYKVVASDISGNASSATKASQDGNGKVISSTYETKTDASNKLSTAKTYADNVATTAANKVKNELLNGAGTAFDTLKELGDLITDNQEAIDVLENVASGKANAVHPHAITDITNLQTTLNGKQSIITGGATTIASSNLTANRALIANSSGKVAVSDVTSTELGYLDGVTSSIQAQLDTKAVSGHTHSIANVSGLQSALDEFKVITSEEVQNLFN